MTGARTGGGTTLASLLDRQVGKGGDRPFLTFYDDDRGDRVELSYKTFDNWVRKLANLLVDEYGVAGGDRVATVAGVHWQASAVHVACWYVGATAVPVAVPVGAAAEGADGVEGAARGRDVLAAALAHLQAAAPVVTFVREEWLAPVREASRGPLVALTADTFGRPAADLGATPNFSRIVPAMPDDYDGETGARDGGALLLDPAGGGDTLRQGDLLDQAAATADAWRLTEADRVMTSTGDHDTRGTVTALLAPFTAGAGTVRNRTFGLAAFWPRVAGERVSVVTVTAAEARSLVEGAGQRPEAADRLRLAVCAGGAPPADLAASWQTRFGVPLASDPPAGSASEQGGSKQEG